MIVRALAGALLLGHIFSAWDILPYGVGIALGALLDRIAVAKLTARNASHSDS
jgi:hypothetical protein